MSLHAAYGTLLALGDRRLDTVHGEFRAHVFRNLATRTFVLAVGRGDLCGAAPLLARVHSSCVTSESFGACDCDCAQQLEGALQRIAAKGRGVVFYLLQEGRGAGFAAKVRDRMIVQASRDRVTTFEAYERMGLGRDYRHYDDVPSALRLLGVGGPLQLLTNNPEKLAALEAVGVPVAGTVPIRHDPSPWNAHYLAAKSRSGHSLSDPAEALRRAELPGPVRYFEPMPLADAPRFVHVASYFLPVAGLRPPGMDEQRAPHWFRLHAYHDLQRGVERVVLQHEASPDAVPLVHVQREALLERFPLREGGHFRDAWGAAVPRIVARGAGVTLFVPVAGNEAELGPSGDATAPDEPLDTATLRLVARHLTGRRAQPLCVSRDATALCRALSEAGIALLPPLGRDAA